MDFRENLKLQLSYSDILVKELAELSGVKKSTIDSYLSNRVKMPSAEAAIRLARALGVPVEHLLGMTKDTFRGRRVQDARHTDAGAKTGAREGFQWT